MKIAKNPYLLPETDSICPVHGNALRDDWVPVLCDLPCEDDDFHVARDQQFPKSKFVMYGGSADSRLLYHQVRFCERCRQSHQAWCAERGIAHGLPISEEEFEKHLFRDAVRLELDDPQTEAVAALLAKERFMRAIKLLKLANPTVEIPLLSQYLKEIQRRDRLTQQRQEIAAKRRTTENDQPS